MRICPKCGEQNPERFGFCGVCGSPLETTPISTAEERKVVSILFVDLVGFTASSDRADPEDVRARLRPYHSMLKREIERFGGTVEKFIGDAVMAVFGAPIAHEDDAERAVRAALRIAEAISELNEENSDLNLSIRAAVNTGEAVVALGAKPEQGEGIVTGDVVNTASRLQGVAPVGGVAVGEITYRVTKDAIEYKPLDPVSVKGKEDPLPIWHAVRARGRSTPEIERTSTPFIGRQNELSLLQQTFTRTLQENSLQLVTVMGEPGVGKSRLTSEFFAWIDALPDLVFWRHGRCLPYGEGITFWAVGEIMKAHAGILESDPPEEAASKLADAVDLVIEEGSEREWVKSRLAPLVGSETTSAAIDRGENFTAWRTFLEAIASSHPLVLLIEDLHWADDSMLEFVDHLVDWTTGVPLLVLCTARPELFERHPGWGGGKRNSSTIGLSPLSGDETAQLISSLLAETVLPAETQQALLGRAGGNPLYAEEFVRMLLDRGILERRGHAVELTKDAEIPVPESVQALIAARLDTLSVDRKALMHDAAVVGKVFWSEAVASMSGRSNEEIRQGLHELARKELVRPARKTSIEDQTEYSFWHALVRDVAYGQIPRAARATKHRAAAEWIENMAGVRVGDHAEILAFHYEEALRLARAAGAADEEARLSERAIEFLTMSGARAFHLDLVKAESYYQRALELAPRDHPRRGSILLQAALATRDRGGNDEAVRGFEEAIAALESVGDVAGTGEAQAGLAWVFWRRGETARGRALAEKAVQLLETEPPGPELAVALNAFATFLMLSERHEEAILHAGRAIEVSEGLGLRAPIVRALATRGVSLVQTGNLEEGVDDLERALRMGTDLGLGFETAGAYGNLSTILEWNQGISVALELLQEGTEFCSRRGLGFLEMWLKCGQASLLFPLGRWSEASAASEEVLEWDRGRGTSQLSTIANQDRARMLMHQGRTEEAAALIEEMLPRARDGGIPQMVVPSISVAAEVELARGRETAAVQLIHEIGSITEKNPTLRARVLAASVRVLTRCGALEYADELIQGISPRTSSDKANLLTARAVLDEAHGSLESGAALYQEAAEAWTKRDDLVERAQALLGEGRCLVQLGRMQEATERLTAARDAFASFGAGPLTAEADEWLARASALSS